MAYSRHTIVYFDKAKKDSMLASLVPQMDQSTKAFSGVIGARLSHGAEDCLGVYSIYENQESADTIRSRENDINDSLVEFIVQQPDILEGEIIWGFDGNDQSLTAEIGHYAKEIIPPRYVTHHLVDVSVSEYDPLILEFSGTRDLFRSTRGLIRLRVAYISEHRIIVTTIYNDKPAADAAHDCIRYILSRSEIMAENVGLLEGDLMWSSSYAEAVFGGRFIN